MAAGLLAMGLLGLLCALDSGAWARPKDAGAPKPKPDSRKPSDARATPDKRLKGTYWERRVKALTAGITKLNAQAAALDKLTPEDPVPAQLKKLFAVDLEVPPAVAAQMEILKNAQVALDEAHKVKAARVSVWERDLQGPADELAKLRKRKRRWRRLKLPVELLKDVKERMDQATQMRLERDHLAARRDLLIARRDYLERTQPARLKADDKRKEEALKKKELMERTSVKKAKVLEAQKLSAAERIREAEEASLRAKSEADKLLNLEVARLARVSSRQSDAGLDLNKQRDALEQRRLNQERFRGNIASAADKLAKAWPKTAPAYDKLYDKVAKKLGGMRPDAVDDLMGTLKGPPSAPGPGGRDLRLSQLDKVYQPRAKKLEKRRQELLKKATELEKQSTKLTNERLDFLQREITWLNEHRISLLPRLTENKRDDLITISRTTIEQLSREVLQLTFDGAYYAFKRLRQLTQWRQLVRDFFAISGVVWTVMKLIFLLLLLRFVLRNWDEWSRWGLQQVQGLSSLGRQMLRLVKLLDALRHSGPALLTLITVWLVFRLVGGEQAATEFKVVYIVIFWVAVYRLQLRVVETLARYTGMEDALRAAEGEELLEEEDEDLEGPPVPRAVRLAQRAQSEGALSLSQQTIVPASVLLVRSVRAATRYILVVVLVLELTALAVGKGTIYGLTARFSWWATLPFLYYFLRLWRPHIVRAYKHYTRDKRRSEDTLGRLVEQSKDRFYGVFVIGAAFITVLGYRLARFARNYLSSLDATKQLLAFIFRRQVERHAQQAGNVVGKRCELPEDILEQFPAGPVEVPTKRVELPAVKQIKEVFTSWLEDQADGSIAIIAPAGYGKSTLLRQLPTVLRKKVLRHRVRGKITRPAKVVSWLSEVFGFSPKPSSEKELIRMIREDKSPVVALDNCHNLFLRKVGGFEGWKCFLRVVNETCDNVFWVLTFNRAAWDYLDNFSGRVNYFRRVVEIAPWTERHIRRLIMTRMHRARYGVSFDDLVMTQMQDVAVSSQVGRTSQGYFRVLWNFTGGNPRLACHFWLDSLVPVEGKRIVQVHLFSEPPIAKLEALPDDIVFVLTAITERKSLTPDEAAQSTNLPKEFCVFAFRYCLENGFLQHGEGGRMRLSVRWQRPVIRYLKRRYLVRGL